MDINATLEELRILTSENHYGQSVSEDDAVRLVEVFRALDEWITNGGFLPADWARNR